MDKRHIIATYNINPQQRSDVFYTPHNEAEIVWQVDGYDYFVRRNGEMRAHFTTANGEEETLYTTSDFERVGITTDALLQLADDRGLLDWVYNPWFEIDSDKYSLYDGFGSDEIFGDIVEAIERAIHLSECKHEGTLLLNTDGEVNYCEDCYFTEVADPFDIANQYRLLAENESNPEEKTRLTTLAEQYESKGN
jgi:hypothetical protein